jgi:hydroxymethylpyrimidine/phosphomethylpyrimidine kinase
MGPNNVLIKGGHLKGECVDILYDGQEFFEFSSARINTKNTHGTGCIFSSAIAAEVAKGFSPFEAVQRAKEFITTSIKFSLPLGHGHGPANPFANISRNAQIFECAAELKNAFKKLQGKNIGHIIPEVQSNLGYAILSASSPEDVLGFPGRIIRIDETVTTVSAPEAGASKHISKIILTAMKHDKAYRSAMNICYTPSVIERCKFLGLRVCEFDRAKEPSDIKEIEGSTLEWGTEKAITSLGYVPDIIFDRGDIGKEPMTRVLGTDPMDVAHKIISIAKEKGR